MEETIQSLYDELQRIEEDFLDYQKRKELLPVQKCFGRIQEFAVWFMQADRLGQGEHVWKELNQRLLGILQDMVQAIEEGDYVLLHDAVTYGLLEYLAFFLPTVAEGETDDTL